MEAQPQAHLPPRSTSTLDSDSDSTSDCESGVSSSLPPLLFPESLAVKLPESHEAHRLIRRCFLTPTVFAIYRKNWAGFSNQARLDTFRIHSQAVADKNGGANVRFAWYGNRKDRIVRVLEFGFSHTEIEGSNNGGVFLSPHHSPYNSFERAIPDEDGLRHLLLCRVIVGRPEFMRPGSDQTHPSSNEFDSGVDVGNGHIIWSSQMNTHILPELVVSFRGSEAMKMKANPVPASPWLPFSVLISELGKYLAQDALTLINKYYIELKEKKINRLEMVRKLRLVAGDKLVIAIIKSYYPGGPRYKTVQFGNKTNKK